MKKQSSITAASDQQNIVITREFDLPLERLFKAHVVPEIVAQWMGTRVVKLDCKRHGSFQFETTDPTGKIHRFNGTIHDFEPNEKITRTFQMEHSPFPVQLEFLTFEQLSSTSSKLTMNIVFKSAADRDNMLKLPFARGIDLAHNRLQKVAAISF